MKLFKSLLVAPATLGLLAPLSATANEVTINDFNPAEELAVTNSRVDGLEARLNNFEAGGFSETTTASFSVDAAIGAIDGDTTSEATTFDYQFNIGLSTSFTGEDSLDIAIDSGSTANLQLITQWHLIQVLDYLLMELLTLSLLVEYQWLLVLILISVLHSQELVHTVHSLIT